MSKQWEEIEHRLKLRNLKLSDYNDVAKIMSTIYKSEDGVWTKAEFRNQLRVFPEGQICIEDNGKVVAGALSIIVDYDRFGDNHNYDQITGYGKFDTHDDEGDTLYGTDIFVDKEYRGMRIGRRLYDARKELCENLNLRSIIAGGRIPGYAKYAKTLSPRKYIDQVKNKEIFDPVLSFQLANEFHVRKVITKYLPLDTDSRAYATLLEWINIYYEKDEKLIGNKSIVRLGLVQWKMRRFSNVDDLMQQVEFFVDTVSGYKSDFCLLPEFFNAPLLAEFNHLDASEAIRHLAEYSEEIVSRMSELAVSYNVNIIAGSMPEYDGKKLLNVSYLCRRDGTNSKQYKLHVTPDEAAYWGLQGGNGIKVFDTDSGRIGILICYDVEFPELGRILAEQEMDILFVPFWTDTKNAFLRVDTCAKSRAIENECYVAITGSVGNLPKVENMDIQFSKAAIYSPSDFSFPHDAVVAQASENFETTIVADVDLSLLTKQRKAGSVRNLEQRRLDLYSIQWKQKN
ncbi:bifunctional GNAT family N-acetyltransferase/carbon-nitrogen hydrolase family protein [Algoriphagus sediminis]|uniref:GNAT family N-acetyltransferase n=1 Tax=Algoriphagus sediminis TaxID=3057113 RepID=A0ABT7Y8F8_9BACT|nr:bifunctional GNAT family N-acetyltransferase/carbon-nitrogen hydrolase family protein [Algoriphagus sediminis]MDN3202755.1 GNAT family N-acetyltransferase [Algoriphagus sediminis]